MVSNIVKYRLAKMRSNHPIEYAYVMVVHSRYEADLLEQSFYFIEWITDWKEL